MSILEWSGVGVGAVVCELRSGRGGGVGEMVWSEDGKELDVLGGRDGGEVEVWNVGERRVVRKWGDEGAFGGEVLKRGNGGYTAIGSALHPFFDTKHTNSYHPTHLDIRYAYAFDRRKPADQE